MPIHSNTVHLHRLDLDGPSVTALECWNLLDESERSRARRFRLNEVRGRWTVARAGLRSILSIYCDCSPTELEFGSGPFGKPFLSGSVSRAGVAFNLLHPGCIAVVAVGVDADVGIDVEFKKHIWDWPGVARRNGSRPC